MGAAWTLKTQADHSVGSSWIEEEVVWKISHAKSICLHLLFLLQMKQVEGRRGASVSVWEVGEVGI